MQPERFWSSCLICTIVATVIKRTESFVKTDGVLHAHMPGVVPTEVSGFFLVYSSSIDHRIKHFSL